MPAHHHGTAAKALLAALALATSLITGCASNDDTAESPSKSPTETAAPADPFDSGTPIHQWQQDTVTEIITTGKSRTDVDDTAVLAALVATRAESQWLVKTVGPGSRNLFGWTPEATNSSWRDTPDSPEEIARAINAFFDQTAKLAASGSVSDNPAELALSAQTGDDTKNPDYYADRLCTGEQAHKFCTPDKARAGYENSLAPATAAFELMSR